MGGEHGTISHREAALTRTMNTLGRKTKTLKDGEANLGGDHIREGLTAIISVKVPEPEFEGQTKTRLGNPEVRKILDSVLAKVGRPTPICTLAEFPHSGYPGGMPRLKQTVEHSMQKTEIVQP